MKARQTGAWLNQYFIVRPLMTKSCPQEGFTDALRVVPSKRTR